MIRLTSFLAGLVALPVIGVGLAYTEPAERPLCVNSHPAKRTPGVTYGGLLALHGYQRDHWPYPLCLGQIDTADHVRYQLLDEAHEKDRLERYACESYCAGAMDLLTAQGLFDDWPRSYQQVFGEWPPHAKAGAEGR